MKKKWDIHSPDPEEITKLTATMGCHRAIAAVLINRGFGTYERAKSFLRPSLAHIRSPFLMKDMQKAVSRIVLAIRRREKILIWGDYDVDGITATALLLDFLAHLDVNVDYHIPDRLTEGYGLSQESVKRFAISRNINLIITVDCGISSYEAIRAARSAGIDVIITDHHEPPSHLPEAIAILNPKQPDCPSASTTLAGVGVAFNLVLALRKRLREEDFWKTRSEPNLRAQCDLVALGTVADMVPLLEENRIYVKTGLDVLATAPRPGLKALMDVCRIINCNLDTWDMAFKLAPRLNAAGRLCHASLGCELLTTSSGKTARTIADRLNGENNRRKDMEKLILSGITRQLEANPELVQRSLVLDHAEWHEGIIGIVASRLVDRYVRPVVLIAVNNGIGKGSARSPEGFNLFEALKECAVHLERFGGHDAAAGLILKAENISAFRTHFEKIVRENTKAEVFVPKLHIDTKINPEEITSKLADEIEQLAPFGTGNPEPVFMLSDMDVIFARIVGDRHMQMRLRPANKPKVMPLDAILFNVDTDEPPQKNLHRVACKIRWNRWMDRKNIQLVIKDYVAAGDSPENGSFL